MIVETAETADRNKNRNFDWWIPFRFSSPPGFRIITLCSVRRLVFRKESDSITHQFDNNLICWEPSSLPIYFDSLFYIHFYIYTKICLDVFETILYVRQKYIFSLKVYVFGTFVQHLRLSMSF